MNAQQIKNRTMVLVTKDQHEQLLEAGDQNMEPIVKFFNPSGQQTWLATGIEDGIIYGYADLGFGCVEWGSLFSVEELPTLTFFRGLITMERDRHWTHKPGTKYLERDSLMGV